MASAQLRYRRHFGDDRESWIGAGLTQYHWGVGEEWSAEAAVEVLVKADELIDTFTFWPYVQVAHDFHHFEGTYARGGVWHRVGIQHEPGEIFLDLDLSVSASDYAGGFGYHATEGSAWFHWPLPKLRERDFGVELGGGYTWAANEISRDGGWVGVRVKVSQ
jgi:hypothetical protein